MPGRRLLPLSNKIAAKVATPTMKVVQLALPSNTAWPIAYRFRSGPPDSIEKPNSLGSWLINTVSAIPFILPITDRLRQQLGNETQADPHQAIRN